jgi:linoleate 10R-lipoxygenase
VRIFDTGVIGMLILILLDNEPSAILADAVALVRGDRYLTYDCTPFNLTPWGFTEGSRNVNNAAHGGMLGRVIQRALPNHYNDSSVYTHFPLITPTGQRYSMDKVLRTRGVAEKYSLDRPVAQLPVQVLTDTRSIAAALGLSDGPQYFITPYGPNIRDVKLDRGFLAVVDDTASLIKATALLKQIVVPSQDALNRTLTWFRDRTLELIREKNLTLVNPSQHIVDLVKDVFRLVPVHWSASQVVS